MSCCHSPPSGPLWAIPRPHGWTSGKPGGEKPSVALTFLRLFSLPCWFAWTLWSLFSMSAHSKLLTVNSEGGMPATEEAARKTALGRGGFSRLTQSWLPAQAPYKVQGLAVWVGGRKRKEEGRKGGGSAWWDLFLRKQMLVFYWVLSLGAGLEKEFQQLNREDCQQAKWGSNNQPHVQMAVRSFRTEVVVRDRGRKWSPQRRCKPNCLSQPLRLAPSMESRSGRLAGPCAGQQQVSGAHRGTSTGQRVCLCSLSNHNHSQRTCGFESMPSNQGECVTHFQKVR